MADGGGGIDASRNGPPRGRPGGGLTGPLAPRWHGANRKPAIVPAKSPKRHQSRLVRHCAGTLMADGLDFPLAVLRGADAAD